MLSLSGVRVVEVAEMVAGPWASKLLADFGADVIKIEPPDGDRSRRVGPFPADAPAPGDPDRSGVFLALNTNKRNRVLDLDTDDGMAALADLVADADIVIHDLPASRAAAVGLDGDALLRAHPHLVVCAITPFGQTGPMAEWVAEEINLVHGGGWGFQIPGDDPDASQAPLTVPGWPANCQAGMAAAFAVLGAHRKSMLTGVGEFIDMAAMAQVSAMLEASFIAWTYLGEIARRHDGRILTPWGIFHCADGLIFMVTVEQDQWERLVEMMGNPDWATGGLFDTVEDRGLNQDVLRMFIDEWTSQHTVDELFHEGQRRRICFAPVFTMADLARQDHLRARGFFHEVDHPRAGRLEHLGAPARMTPSPWALRTPAPLLGEASEATFDGEPLVRSALDPDAVTAKPLDGIRVIDFTWVWAGPFGTMHLAYLGADVIKIESSTRPNLGRRLPIHPPELEPTLNTSGYFNQWDQGKRSIELDLSDPASIDTVLGLIAEADVVIDNYATGVMDRLGLDDETLRAANPDLIIASVTGYGHNGPLAHYMGYGPTTCPLSGLTSLTGRTGGEPKEAGLSLGDPAAGLATAFAVVAAIYGRDRGDEPLRIDTSLWEATAPMALHAWMGHVLGAPVGDGPDGNRHFAAVPHGVFPATGDDEWVTIACMSDEQWVALAELISVDAGRFPTLAERKANEAELEAAIAAWTGRQDKWVVAERLQQAGIPSHPTLNCAELAEHPQLEAREFWARFDHPEVGVRAHSGVPWRTRNWPNGVSRRAPLLGEHTAEVLGDVAANS